MPIGTGRVAEPAGSGGSTGLERLLARVLAAPRLVVPACPGNAGPVGLPDRGAQCIRLIRRRVLSGRTPHSLNRRAALAGESGDHLGQEATFGTPGSLGSRMMWPTAAMAAATRYMAATTRY